MIIPHISTVSVALKEITRPLPYYGFRCALPGRERVALKPPLRLKHERSAKLHSSKSRPQRPDHAEQRDVLRNIRQAVNTLPSNIFIPWSILGRNFSIKPQPSCLAKAIVVDLCLNIIGTCLSRDVR